LEPERFRLRLDLVCDLVILGGWGEFSLDKVYIYPTGGVGAWVERVSGVYIY
jgi:hypothetical protein